MEVDKKIEITDIFRPRHFFHLYIFYFRRIFFTSYFDLLEHYIHV